MMALHDIAESVNEAAEYASQARAYAEQSTLASERAAEASDRADSLLKQATVTPHFPKSPTVFTARSYDKNGVHMYSTRAVTIASAIKQLENLYDPETDSKIEITWHTP